MKPIIPITIIAFCFTVIVSALVTPFNITTQAAAVAISNDNETKTIARDATLSNNISFKQTNIQTKEGLRAKVTLTSTSPIQATTRIRVKVTGGTAKSGTDYRLPSIQTITFYKGGLREKSFTIPITLDKSLEQPETIILSLFSSADKSLNKEATIIIGDKVSSTTRPPTPTTPPTSNTLVDLNAIPTDTSLDANGWPKYLNVPATCAKPTPAKRYVFEQRKGLKYGTTEDTFKDTWISSFFGFNFGSNFYINTTDDEIMAMPFFVPYVASFSETQKNIGGGGNFGDFGIGSRITLWSGADATNRIQATVSKCPGDFNLETVLTSSGSGFTGEGGLNIISGIDGESMRITAGFNKFESGLNQGEYYFINIRNDGGCNEGARAIGFESFVPKRNGKPVCTNVASFGSLASKLPPYTGSIRLSNGPYPLRFSNVATYQQSATNTEIDNGVWRCFDATGKGPEMQYEVKSGVWTEPGKPAYPTYICGSVVGGTNSKSFSDVKIYDLCVKPNVGNTRTSKVSKFGLPFQHIDTCVFDTAHGVYAWKTTTRSHGTGLFDESTQIGLSNFTAVWNGTPGTVEYKTSNGALLGQERFH